MRGGGVVPPTPSSAREPAQRAVGQPISEERAWTGNPRKDPTGPHHTGGKRGLCYLSQEGAFIQIGASPEDGVREDELCSAIASQIHERVARGESRQAKISLGFPSHRAIKPPRLCTSQ